MADSLKVKRKRAKGKKGLSLFIGGGTTNYTRNSLNQYVSVGGTSYSYDKNGNLTFDGRRRYYYDCENRLTEVNDVNDEPVAVYKYDFAGRRVKKIIYGSPNVVRRYIYDGDQVIEERNDNGGPLLKYYYGPGIDEPICMHRTPYGYGEGAGLFYYHYDGLGSVVAISDANGEIVERYEYDVFGRSIVHTGAGADGIWMTADDVTDSKSALDNPFMFTGRRYDAETGLYYYRARYYNAYIGRFMSADPIAMYMQYASVSQRTRDRIPGTYLFPSAVQKFMQYDPIGRYLQMDPAGRFLQNMRFGVPVELNLYTYVGNNPNNFIDPYGHGKRLRRAWFIFKIYMRALREAIFGPSPKQIKETYDASKTIVEGMKRANREGKDTIGEDIYPPFADDNDDDGCKK